MRERRVPLLPQIGASVAILLALAWVYSQVRTFGLVNLDDSAYVTDNPAVRAGLSWDGVLWAFTHLHAAYYIPLTWISLMFDVSFYGNVGGMHVSNVVLHAFSSITLGCLLVAATGDTWRSWWVAAIFAVHPCQVESVAWITERKDVLSTALALPALGAYGLYAVSIRRQPSAGRRVLWMGAALLFYALSLLAKPLWVPMPLMLLVLDQWPLQRFASMRWFDLLVEKSGFVALALLGAASTISAQSTGGAIAPLADWPLWFRLISVPWSFAVYLATLFWPIHLAAFYPLPDAPSPWLGLIGVLVILAISLSTFVARHHWPEGWVGWLWFVVLLLPVSGIAQAGDQVRADRFTYVPMIGVAVAAAGATRLLSGQILQRGCAVLGVLLIAAATGLATSQAAYWRNGTSLFEHAVAVTRDNWKAEFLLGDAYREAGRAPQAEAAYVRGLALRPRDGIANLNLGNLRLTSGRSAEAMAPLLLALEALPQIADTHNSVGGALVEQRRYAEAIVELERALRIDPQLINAQFNLGDALFAAGRFDEALVYFRRALQQRPDIAELHRRVAATLERLGHTAEAHAEYQQAERLDPAKAGG